MQSSRPPVSDDFDMQPETRTAFTAPSGQTNEAEFGPWREWRFGVPSLRAWRRGAGWRSPTLPKASQCKRAADIVIGMLLVVFFAPLMAVIALAVCLDGGPVLYGHLRIGPDRRQFRCWKFRTMVVNADQVLQQVLARDETRRAEWDGSFKLRNDPRVTLMGQFLRAFSLDELPQLLNVIRGEMSLVGPRPIVEAEIDRYGPNFTAYSDCRPGMTGLWQVRGRSDVSYLRRVQLDTEYARKWSLWLDFKILLSTLIVVVRGDGAC
jgi:Undecaprenyl-phosphate galactose phosphotransferase WbaP